MDKSTRSENIRISLPSKGRLMEDSRQLFADSGLSVHQENPRQYEASIPSQPGVSVIFQRPADIVVSVRDGSVDFGVTGFDVVAERRGDNDEVIVIHDSLGFGTCKLCLAVPESWTDIQELKDLKNMAMNQASPLRVATKYPVLTGRFLEEQGVKAELITAEGTLETAPTIGYADYICDIVSSGQTLHDNRLRPLKDGIVLTSQAVLIANRRSLIDNPKCLETARTLLEFIEAHLRAERDLAVFANMRGESPEAIADRIFNECSIAGLQGPTISRVIVREQDKNWYAVNIIVPRNQIIHAIRELRAIGGSGVVAMPITYIFDEEPERITLLLQSLGKKGKCDG